jgi:hypothetical protein
MALPSFEETQPVPAKASSNQGALPSFEETQPVEGALPSFEETQPVDPNDTLKAGAEAVGRGVLGPIAPYLEKRWGYATPEAMLRREERHPILDPVMQTAGLVASMASGVGEGALMVEGGETAAKMLGLAKPTTYAAKVGSAIVKNAAEMTVMGSGDETAKMVMNDPNTSVETALGHVGLAAGIGAGTGAFFTGAVSPIWKATVGNKVESGLKSLLDGMQSTIGRTSVQDLVKQADLPVSEILTAKGNGVPFIGEKIDEMAGASDTKAGKSAAKALQQDSENISKKIAEVTTGDPNYLDNVPKEDSHTTGQNVIGSLQKDLGIEVNSTTAQMEQSAKQLDHAPFSVQNQGQTADDIAQTIINNNWHKGQSDADLHLMEDVLHKLDRQETAGDLRSYLNKLKNNDSEAAGVLKKVLGDAIERSHAESGVPEEVIQGYKAAQQGMDNLNSKLDALNEHLHIGKFDTPQEFLSKMNEKYGSNPEAILRNLSGKSKADTIQLLAQVSPDTLEVIRQHHVNELMRDSMVNGKFSALKYTNKLNDLSPQIRNLVADPLQQQQLSALTQLAQHANVKASFADKQAESLLKKIKTPLALIAAINGHGLRAVMDILGIHVAKEGKEAVKLSLLKLLSSSQPANAEGFQSMANFINNVYKGQNTVAKGVGYVLGTGAKIAAIHNIPTQEDRDKLQKQIDKITQDPNKNPQSSLGHYMDQHQAAMQAVTQKQVQYLNGLKPKDAIISPLEPHITASKAAMARYNRAMDIALNPMICLKKIKDGSLQATDCVDLSNMYPSLRNSIANQFTTEISKNFQTEESPSYKTRMGLSLFLGQALDDTMTPTSIMAAQPKPQQGPQQPPAPKGKGKGSPSKMSNKSSNLYKTSSQEGEQDRSDRD